MALAPALVLLHQNLDVGTNLTEIQIHVLNERGKKRERKMDYILWTTHEVVQIGREK